MESAGMKLGRTPQEEGCEIGSFECRTGGESVSRAFLPAILAIIAGITSAGGQYHELIIILFIALALLPVLVPLVGSAFPRTRAMCVVREGGIRIRPLKSPTARARFLTWSSMERFSAKPAGLVGGRIYLYPKGLLSVLRREVIQTLSMADYQLLFNHVSTRVGVF